MDTEQLAQEAAIWPWIDDASMADPPEDYYLPPEEAYLDDCFNDGPDSECGTNSSLFLCFLTMDAETFPISLPLAFIDWQDLSRGFHGGYYCSERIRFLRDDGIGESDELEITIQQYTSDHADFFGVNVDAWQVFVRIFDPLSPNGREYHCGGDFSSANNAKEYAAYIVWQFKKGNKLACVPSEFID